MAYICVYAAHLVCKSQLAGLEVELEFAPGDRSTFRRRAWPRAARAWEMIEASEVSRPCRVLARLAHQTGWHRGWRPLRSLGLYLLETS